MYDVKYAYIHSCILNVFCKTELRGLLNMSYKFICTRNKDTDYKWDIF